MINLKGAYLILVRNAKTLRILKKIHIKNAITTNCLRQFPLCISGQHPFTFERSVAPDQTGCPTLMRKYWYLVLGTSDTPPDPSDTGLGQPVSETARHGTITVNGDIAQYYVRYLPEEANGYTYKEIGIYDLVGGHWVDTDPDPEKENWVWTWYDYTHGTLFTHALIDPPITKTIDIVLDCYAQITFTS